MKIITQFQLYNLMIEYRKNIYIPDELSRDEKKFILSEWWMMAGLGTNFQESFVNDWILHLIKDIKSKQ
ncbi:hypothetical protein K0M00_005417 [Escherichia coli]|uniref:hypothetical protein n=1 Tax=Escherichia coli TaxID=562 RepID=UPI001A5A8767|nr:hypothetical protein [Escherichia coli]EHV4444251.1 hypothetical protein [Escherichia coli]VVZ32221.1 Uncharacterised protein [Escherichia coli]